MTDSPPIPGHDQIALTTPDGRQVCHRRDHAWLGVLAEVVVTFGELGGAAWDKDAVWPGCWGRSFAMCGECCDTIRQLAHARRPGLVITDTRLPHL